MRCALDVDIHDHIGAVVEEIEDFGFERSVEIAMDFGEFEEVTSGDFGLELLVGEEVVIEAVDFAWARGAGGARDRVVGFA